MFWGPCGRALLKTHSDIPNNVFRVEYAMAVWSYYDDSAIVEPKRSAFYTWYIFLQTHQLLRIPIKGNPLSSKSEGQCNKFFPPAECNKFLGEMTHIGSLPCTAGPTESRRQTGREMIDAILATMELPPRPCLARCSMDAAAYQRCNQSRRDSTNGQARSR